MKILVLGLLPSRDEDIFEIFESKQKQTTYPTYTLESQLTIYFGQIIIYKPPGPPFKRYSGIRFYILDKKTRISQTR